MTPLLLGTIGLAGGLGSAARFLLDGVIASLLPARYRLGMFVVNVSGSLLLGLVTGGADARLLHSGLELILGVGLLGGYTTFSAASPEPVRLVRQRRILAALLHSLGMLITSVEAAALGYCVGAALCVQPVNSDVDLAQHIDDRICACMQTALPRSRILRTSPSPLRCSRCSLT